MALIKGTHLDVRFSRVVDGDTIRVFLPNQAEDESLRILALDTEESYGGSGKPVTPLGKEAKKKATDFFQGAAQVTIEFPGNEDVATCIKKYRGNYGRLLVFVYRDGEDFQETMIETGYSPYFVKYGNAAFAGHHRRYQRAERAAQRGRLGVWDQFANNHAERRNYAALGTWWTLRAGIIDEYRRLKGQDDSLLNSRLDYATIEQKAHAGEDATVFTALSSVRRVGGRHGLVSIGSIQQPFGLFIPDIDAPDGQQIVDLLETRYISGGDTHPRRSYAYVTGELSLYDQKPQIVLTSSDQITDGVPDARNDGTSSSVRIASLLPDPAGADRGKERVTLRNDGQQAVDLQGWILQDRSGHRVTLQGPVAGGQEREIALAAGQMPLNNTGDEVVLLDADGKVRSRVVYSAADVTAGEPIEFT